jgi:hypothetical protein
MNPYGWQKKVRVLVEGTGGLGELDVPLPEGRPVLEKLTVWMTTDETIGVEQLTFQARINGEDFGTPVVIGAGVAPRAQLVFQSGDGAADALLIPTSRNVDKAPEADLDPFDFVINIANAVVADQQVTLYFAGAGYAGG